MTDVSTTIVTSAMNIYVLKLLTLKLAMTLQPPTNLSTY
jgi:hypothetical protein